MLYYTAMKNFTKIFAGFFLFLTIERNLKIALPFFGASSGARNSYCFPSAVAFVRQKRGVVSSNLTCELLLFCPKKCDRPQLFWLQLLTFRSILRLFSLSRKRCHKTLFHVLLNFWPKKYCISIVRHR